MIDLKNTQMSEGRFSLAELEVARVRVGQHARDDAEMALFLEMLGLEPLELEVA